MPLVVFDGGDGAAVPLSLPLGDLQRPDVRRPGGFHSARSYNNPDDVQCLGIGLKLVNTPSTRIPLRCISQLNTGDNPQKFTPNLDRNNHPVEFTARPSHMMAPRPPPELHRPPRPPHRKPRPPSQNASVRPQTTR